MKEDLQAKNTFKNYTNVSIVNCVKIVLTSIFYEHINVSASQVAVCHRATVLHRGVHSCDGG